MSTTYTISDAAHDGNYVLATGVYDDTATTVSPTRFFVFHFPIAAWDHTLLTEASFAFHPSTFTAGTYTLHAIVAGDGAPTSALLASARLAHIGTFVASGTESPAGRLTFNLKLASTETVGAETLAWTPLGGDGVSSTGFGAAQAAWVKHERDATDASLFASRTVTIILKAPSTGNMIVGVVGGLPAQLILTTTASNTGLVGSQYVRDWERGRASGVIECPKSGFDIAADEAIRDGYTGLMVAPEAYDPPEPKRRTVRPQTTNPRRAR